jgi:SNF2 family DNA or RNA helicase
VAECRLSVFFWKNGGGVMEEYLNRRKWNCCRIDGLILTSDKSKWMFLTCWTTGIVFLVSARAEGLCINLTAADNSDWNSHADS